MGNANVLAIIYLKKYSKYKRISDSILLCLKPSETSLVFLNLSTSPKAATVSVLIKMWIISFQRRSLRFIMYTNVLEANIKAINQIILLIFFGVCCIDLPDIFEWLLIMIWATIISFLWKFFSVLAWIKALFKKKLQQVGKYFLDKLTIMRN